MDRSMSEDSVTENDTDANPDDAVVKEHLFIVHFPALASQKCLVTLTKSSLVIEETKKEDATLNGGDEDDYDSLFECIDEQFPVEDIFGVHIVQKEESSSSSLSKEKDEAVYMCLVIYTQSTGDSENPSIVRKRVARILEIAEEGKSYKNNLEVAKEWACAISTLVEERCPGLYSLRKGGGNGGGGGDGGSLQGKIGKAFKSLHQDQDQKGKCQGQGQLNLSMFNKAKFSLAKSILFERRFLVIVNPVSGQGKSTNLFQDQISPVLSDCGINFDLRTTEYSHHALALMSHLDVTGFDGIISIGGDGLLNEIVNGLRTRKDADKLTDIPIGIIATGSGNGLARSIASYCNVTEEEYKAEPVLHTTLSVCRGCIVPVNLTEVTLDKRVFYSFLSVGWGLLSDIDIESEVLRAIGEIRFFIWSFIRLAKLRRYKASLSYIPHDTGSAIARGRVYVDDEFVSVYSACQQYIGSDMLFAPDAKPNDNVIHLTYLPSNTGRLAAAKFLAELDRGTGNQLSVDPCVYVKVKEFTIRCEGGIDGYLTVDGEQVKGEEITVKVSDTPLPMFALG